jgi:hypothetical protein
MKALPKRLLILLALVAVSSSCSGSSSIPAANGQAVVRDYRHAPPTLRVSPWSICKVGHPCSGGSSLPKNWGTQGSCALGYIDFSDGCEDDSTTFAAQYAGWFDPITFIEANYVIEFDPDHYWKRHLACYLTGTPDQWASAASQFFYLHVYSTDNAPPQSAFADYTFTYQGLPTVFRVFTVKANAFYDVPTAFVKFKPNCPGY